MNGRRSPIAIFGMGYLIGSVAGSIPVPAGIGVVDGGMIGVFVLYGAPAICTGIAVLAYRAREGERRDSNPDFTPHLREGIEVWRVPPWA